MTADVETTASATVPLRYHLAVWPEIQNLPKPYRPDAESRHGTTVRPIQVRPLVTYCNAPKIAALGQTPLKDIFHLLHARLSRPAGGYQPLLPAVSTAGRLPRRVYPVIS